MNSLGILALLSSINIASGLQGGSVPAPNVTAQLFFDISGDGLEKSDLVGDARFGAQEAAFEAYVASFVPYIQDNQHNEEPNEGAAGKFIKLLISRLLRGLYMSVCVSMCV